MFNYLFNNLLNALITAWILALFTFDKICITALKELFNINITTNTYYFIFAIIGLIYGMVMFIINKGKSDEDEDF
jgi:Co/Zn/Cd efflux system component